MFVYGDKTEVNIQFKMLELFRTIKADKIIKQDAGNVTSVKLANILSSDNTNLEDSELVKEIYVFEINLNPNKIPEKFLDALNKSINFQTLMKLQYSGKTKYITSIKTFDEEKLKVLKVFQTDWIVEEKQPLPITAKLENVFKAMLHFISNYKFRDDETFNGYIERVVAINKIKSDIEKLTKTMNNEKQPNMKMKLKEGIKQMKKNLQELEV